MPLEFTYVKAGCKTGKSFCLNESNELEKDDKNGLSIGSFHVIQCENIEDVQHVINDATNNNIIILGTPKEISGTIYCKETEEKVGDNDKFKIERTLKNFTYKQNEGLLLIDYDNDTEFSKYGQLSKEELLNIIYEVAPEIKEAPHMWKTSSSSNIYKYKDSEGKEVFDELAGVKGQHVFVHVKDVSKIKFYAEELFKRFWLAGYGHISISKSGSLLERSVMDSAVNSPERLVFLKSNIIKNKCGELKQLVETECFNVSSKPLDIDSISHLSHDQNIECDKLIEISKEKLNDVSLGLRKEFVKRNYLKLGLNEKDLEYAVISRRLFNDFRIMLWSGVEVTVGEIIRDKEKYDNSYCYEPMERDYGNGSQAFIDCYNEIIYSHAHGGIIYTIADESRRTPEDLAHLLSGIKDNKEKYRKAAKFIIDYNYLEVEMEKLYDVMADYEKVKPASIKKTVRSFLNTETKKRNLDLKESDSILPDYLREPIDISFPDLAISSTGIVTKRNSIDNFTFLLKNYGIKMKYNEITKDIDVSFPDGFLNENDPDMRENSIREVIAHLLDINEMNIEKNITKAILVAKINKHNPPLDWIKSKAWDGKDRIQDVLDRIVDDIIIYEDSSKNKKFVDKYKKYVITSWFIQAVSALDGCISTPLKDDPVNRAEAKYEFLLDFVSPQGLKKTKFVRSLLPVEFEKYIKTGVVLDIKDKDSLMNATKCWFCELGELEETLKINSSGIIKGFLSQMKDSYRVPFGKSIDSYRRTTVFIATVNVDNHLEDPTGNRRFFVLKVKDIVPFNLRCSKGEEIDIQQMWAQFWDMYVNGYQWWPDADEFDRMLKIVANSHTQISAVEELVEEYVKVQYNDEWRKENEFIQNEDNVTSIGDAVVFEPMKTKDIIDMFKIEYSKGNVAKLKDVLSAHGFHDTSKRSKKFGCDKKGNGKVAKFYLIPLEDGKTPAVKNMFG